MAYPNTNIKNSQYHDEPAPNSAQHDNLQLKQTRPLESPQEAGFISVYHHFLEKSHRFYSDAQVKELPRPFAYNVHKKEWEQRGKSLKRFIKYLKKRKHPLRILELGCGMGWFANNLSRLEHCTVVGMDISQKDIAQAQRVFERENLSFVQGDIFENDLEENSFDMVVLNKVMHHFGNLRQLLEKCQSYLDGEGEIHIIDTPVYKHSDLDESVAEQELHYQGLKSESMMDYHYFHTLDDFYPFPYDFMYKPSKMGLKLKDRMKVADAPYPWIRIRI